MNFPAQIFHGAFFHVDIALGCYYLGHFSPQFFYFSWFTSTSSFLDFYEFLCGHKKAITICCRRHSETAKKKKNYFSPFFSDTKSL
jgi:hypothetical protein